MTNEQRIEAITDHLSDMEEDCILTALENVLQMLPEAKLIEFYNNEGIED